MNQTTLLQRSLDAISALLPDSNDQDHGGHDAKDVRDWRNTEADLRRALKKSQTIADFEIRKLWAKHAAKVHDWPNDTMPPIRDIGNGPQFECGWHESEFATFRAGYLAAVQPSTPKIQGRITQ